MTESRVSTLRSGFSSLGRWQTCSNDEPKPILACVRGSRWLTYHITSEMGHLQGTRPGGTKMLGAQAVILLARIPLLALLPV